uniref:L-fucose kinase isoform X2 n=1 Tax=Myxine glutinosa TaxID=7769 RepID=UPI0035901CB6
MASKRWKMNEKVEKRTGVDWTAIVLTCHRKENVEIYQRELEERQEAGAIPASALILAVEDPPGGVGSGGATLNALLVAAEHLSVLAGHTVVSPDILASAHILIFHTGRDYPFEVLGRPFTCLPLRRPSHETQHLICNLDHLHHTLTYQLASGSPPGVWVCSTDMLLSIPPDIEFYWEGSEGVQVLAVPASAEYAQHHGLYHADNENRVLDIIYKGTAADMDRCRLPDGKLPLVAGVAFWEARAAERLLSLHVSSPLDGCTYQGIDSGAQPFSLSLFFDILLAMATAVSEEEFVAGRLGNRCSTEMVIGVQARKVLSQNLRGMALTMMYVPGAQHLYLQPAASPLLSILLSAKIFAIPKAFDHDPLAHSHIAAEAWVSPGSVVLNSIVGPGLHVEEGSAVLHCQLEGAIKVGHHCMLSGLGPEACDSLSGLNLASITIQCCSVCIGGSTQKLYIMLGTNDSLQVSFDAPGATFLNRPWQEFILHTGIREADLWSMGDVERSLWTARLFPVLLPSGPATLDAIVWFLESLTAEKPQHHKLAQWQSAWRLPLKEILGRVNSRLACMALREVFVKSTRATIAAGLEDCVPHSLLPTLRAALSYGGMNEMLETLDDVASKTVAPGVLARALACQADLLAAAAGGRGGLRCGPASNPAWRTALRALEAGQQAEGVRQLAIERQHWLARPELLVRAARHYEGAVQRIVELSVGTVRRWIRPLPGAAPAPGRWICASCPARIDLAGGWSDTPPLAYEHGGTVLTAAVRLNGVRPIGAAARRLEQPVLLLASHDSLPVTGEGGMKCWPRWQVGSWDAECTKLQHLEDYRHPHAPAALLKAACVVSGLVDPHSTTSLQEQLVATTGLELHAWSILPHGSGLGTSSILAGAVLAVLGEIRGTPYDRHSLLHAVLLLEQALTTGGGWQDQLGGLYPGVKLGRSKSTLPLHVEVQTLNPQHTRILEERLVLVYTGRTRLARNLLQDVIRRWYARQPELVAAVDELEDTAMKCAKAFEQGDVETMGVCLQAYWKQKVALTPGTSPLAVQHIMAVLSPLALGQSLAGAGGGGFLFMLGKQPWPADAVRSALSALPGAENLQLYKVAIDQEGLVIKFE